MYVGIYVDDFIYFSPSHTVECKFEVLFSTIGIVRFYGTSDLFSWH
jgi:hypothetical protein